MPTGKAMVIHFGSMKLSPFCQLAPRKCTGTQTIKPYRAAFWKPNDTAATSRRGFFSTAR